MAAMKMTSITSSARTVRWSARKTRSMEKFWKLVGPLNAMGIENHLKSATYGVDRLARPKATRIVSSSVSRLPNIAIAEAERRVRTLDSARTKDASGAMTRAGTAHPSAFAGSKIKPADLAPEAAPDEAPEAAARTRAARLSEFPPARRCRGRARAGQSPPPQAGRRTPVRTSAEPRPPQIAPRRRTPPRRRRG